MNPFRYDRAIDAASAVASVARAPHGAFLAGGTNLVDLMKLEVATPDLLIDVRRLTSDRIDELPDGGLRIGAAVPNSDLAADRCNPTTPHRPRDAQRALQPYGS
jgi:xanthine dehydrogenase YagS FAD-binding subunit